MENGRVLMHCGGEKAKTQEATAIINQRTLRRVAENMAKRVNGCIQHNGGHFQYLL
jgi:hypothetical protein